MSDEPSEIEIYQLDLDEELLSHLSIPESFLAIFAEEVSPKFIEDDFIKGVWDWQWNHFHEHGVPATASVLAEEFDLDISAPLTAIGDLIERLRDRWIKNNVRGYMEEIGEAYKEDPTKVIEVLPRVSREITNIVSRRGEAFGTGDHDRLMNVYDESLKRGPGASYGFPELDSYYHGMRGLNFGLAPPKGMKSWIYGINLLAENIKQGRMGYLYSLELPAAESTMRLHCLVAGVPFWKYLRGSIGQHEREAISEAAEILDASGAYKIIKPPPESRSFEEMINRAGDAGADFVIIDQLQYVETIQGKQLGGCDPREYWQPLNKARDLSDDMPIMCVHQFNRSTMGAEKMPDMQQAKGAAAVEETATLILGMWANKDMRRSGVVEIGTVASRNYGYEYWEVGFNLSKGCNFEILGRSTQEE